MKITIEDDNLMFQTGDFDKEETFIRDEEKRQQHKLELSTLFINQIEEQTHRNISADYMMKMIRKICDNAIKELKD